MCEMKLMPKDERPQKISTSIRLPIGIYTRLVNLKEEKGFESFQDAVIFALTGEIVVDKSIPENCKTCDLYSGFVNGKVMCVVRLENKQPTIKLRSLIEAQGCSNMPTLITMARKEELTREIQNRGQMERHWKDECEKARVQKDLEIQKLRKPIEELLKDKNTLESRVSDMGNTLLERDEKIAVLETDNEQLRIQVTKLSENELLKENDGLHIEVTNMQNKLNDYGLEVKKLEALRDKERLTLNEVLSKTNSVFRDFKQYLPTSSEHYDIEQYIKAMQKKIEQFEGYLATISS